MTMKEALDELQRRRETALRMGGEERLQRLAARGALNARERIARLLDPGSFTELGGLAHSDVAGMEERTPADGRICGFGTIDGRPVLVRANDVTVLAGAGGRSAGEKVHRLTALAIEKGYPIVNLGEAGGARIPDVLGSDGLSSYAVHARDYCLRLRRVPMVATLHGECYGEPAWAAGIADVVIQVRGSVLAVSGPRVLEMATGELADPEELGGAVLHAKVTGLVDRIAENDDEAIRLAREVLSYLPSHAGEAPPRADPDPDAEARQQGLGALVPDDPRRTYDMTLVIAELVDHGRVFSLKPEFDPSVITCLARLDGHVVGIVASQPQKLSGAMGPDGCRKVSSFLCLCDSFNIPLVFLHDTPGFRVGKEAERRGMPGKIVNLLEALALVTVPKVAVVLRKSYGQAYSNMGGFGSGSDFVFAWPTAEMSFMMPEVAANVVYGRRIAAAPDADAARREAVESLRASAQPWRAAGRYQLDDVIEPAEARRVLIRALELARGRRRGGLGERRLASWPTSV